MTYTTGTERRGLFALIGDVPRLVKDLVRGEIELAKMELAAKLKQAGVGAAMLAAAAVLALLFVGVLLTAAVLALALVMPGWAAALIVALIVLIIAAVLGFLGVKAVQKAMPPKPEKALDGLQRDVEVLKGDGRVRR